jgi:imidazoleglycerol phosphate dehydratase HisB
MEDVHMKTGKNVSQIINIVFKAVALAMAVAVVVTNILGVMDTRGQVVLLAIGLFGLAVTALDKE